MTDQGKPAIEMKGVTKRYNGITALQDVNLSLEAGKIYGLLGQNGAGKTTLMSLLNTLRFPTQGKVEIFGQDPYENEDILSRILLIREQNQFQEDLKVKKILKTAEAFYPHYDPHFAGELVELFQLDLNRPFKKLSRGMQSAVGIVVGLAARAEITLLDEPSLGLDVVARNHFYDRMLADYAEHPRTIVLSTHLIDEVSRLFETVIFLDKGKITRVEEAEELRNRAQYLAGNKEAVIPWLEGREVIHQESFGNSLVAAVYNGFTAEEEKQMKKQGIEISGIPLQKLFIYLSEKTLQLDGEAGTETNDSTEVKTQ